MILFVDMEGINARNGGELIEAATRVIDSAR